MNFCSAFSYCTLFVSATWPPEVRRLARAYLKNPFQVSVGSLDLRVKRDKYLVLLLTVYAIVRPCVPGLNQYFWVHSPTDYWRLLQMQKLALVYMIAMCKWLLFDSVVEYVWGAFIWGTLQQNGWVPNTYSKQTTSTSQFILACKLKGGKKKGFGAHWAQAYSHLWELT